MVRGRRSGTLYIILFEILSKKLNHSQAFLQYAQNTLTSQFHHKVVPATYFSLIQYMFRVFPFMYDFVSVNLPLHRSIVFIDAVLSV